MSFSSIVGHHNQIERLKKAILSNRVSHAYLFLGMEGIGKRLTALTFTKALNCKDLNGDSCDSCINCRKIQNLIHPDVEIVEPEGRVIKINRIRELQRRLQYRPLEGRFKVSILDGAERINLSAANALLKTLEEPSKGSVIILISSNVSSLLPTLISRCQRLNFHPLHTEDVVGLIKEKNGVDDDIAKVLASFGQGSIGRILSIDKEWIDKGRKGFLKDIVNVVHGDMEKAFQLAEDIYMDDGLMNYLEILKTWIRDLLVYKWCKDDKKIINSDFMSALRKESSGLSPERLLYIFQGVNECERDILRNANKRLALEVMFMKLSRSTDQFVMGEESNA